MLGKRRILGGLSANATSGTIAVGQSQNAFSSEAGTHEQRPVQKAHPSGNGGDGFGLKYRIPYPAIQPADRLHAPSHQQEACKDRP
jgi:hypothetical protein